MFRTSRPLARGLVAALTLAGGLILGGCREHPTAPPPTRPAAAPALASPSDCVPDPATESGWSCTPDLLTTDAAWGSYFPPAGGPSGAFQEGRYNTADPSLEGHSRALNRRVGEVVIDLEMDVRGGTFMVTPAWDNHRCKVSKWGARQATPADSTWSWRPLLGTVAVRCYGPDGSPRDGEFQWVYWRKGAQNGPSTPHGSAYMRWPGGATPTPSPMDPDYSWNTSGATNLVYWRPYGDEARYPYISWALPFVTGYGQTADHCVISDASHVVPSFGFGTNVLCHSPAGVRTSGGFMVSALPDWTLGLPEYHKMYGFIGFVRGTRFGQPTTCLPLEFVRASTEDPYPEGPMPESCEGGLVVVEEELGQYTVASLFEQEGPSEVRFMTYLQGGFRAFAKGTMISAVGGGRSCSYLGDGPGRTALIRVKCFDIHGNPARADFTVAVFATPF